MERERDRKKQERRYMMAQGTPETGRNGTRAGGGEA